MPQRLIPWLFDEEYQLASGSVYDETGDGGAVGGGEAEAYAVFEPDMSGGGVGGSPTFDNGYNYRLVITVPSGRVAADLYRFLLPVRVTLDPSHVADEDDLLFTDEDDNELAFDVLHYSSGSGRLYAYVKTDLAAASDNRIYLYYGHT
jgi:hypothetical protein